MKITRTLRLLSLLGFLLLLAPFYDTCNGQKLKQFKSTDVSQADTTVVEVDSLRIDATAISKIEVDTISNLEENYEPSIFHKAYEFIDDDDSENAFEFAKTNIDQISEFNQKTFRKELKQIDSEAIFYLFKNLCFTFIVLFSSIILLLSFLRKGIWIYKLSIANLILLTITVVCIFFEGTFENFAQIKWGYYAFITTNVLIFYFSKPKKIKT